MNVDGPTPNGSAAPGPQRPTERSLRGTAPATPRSSREATLAAPDEGGRTKQPLAEPRDTYEHVSSDSVNEDTYTEPHPTESREVRASFEDLQVSVEESYSAEIVDLQTAASAKGLPLRGEEQTPGVLKQDILRAYRKGEEDSGGTPPKKPADILDTLG